MNITLCTGMMRSGSTWSFNVARIVMEQCAKQLHQPFSSGYNDHTGLDNFLQQNFSDKPAFFVIKVHSPAQYALSLIQQGQIQNICTVRDPRDCVASRQIFEDEDFDTSIAFIKMNEQYVNHYLTIKNTLLIRYEEMMKEPIEKIKTIMKYLNINANENIINKIHEQTSMEAAQKISENLEQGSSEKVHQVFSHLVDNTTHIHQNHIHGGTSGRWKTELNEEQQKRVNQEFKDMLIKFNYETPESMEELLKD